MALRPRDYDSLLAGLRELYACPSLADFPTTVLGVCVRLIRGNITAYTEIDPKNNGWKALFDSPESETATLDQVAAWTELFHSHPVLCYHEGTTEPKVRAISDLVTPARWEKEPLYNEFFRLLDILDQLVIPAPRRSELIIGICVDREKRGFSRRDRLIGSLLREHLFQVHANLTVLEKLRVDVQQMEARFAAGGTTVMVINDRGRIINCSSAAASVFQRYFDWRSGMAGILPMSIWRWARAQIQILRRDIQDFRSPEGLIVRKDLAALHVQLLLDSEPGHFLLFAREESVPKTFHVLCRRGLTEREAEVLFWVAQGNSNTQIGSQLAISPRTVQKHLEKIFRTLGVKSRTEATVVALESLRGN